MPCGLQITGVLLSTLNKHNFIKLRITQENINETYRNNYMTVFIN